MSLSFENEFEWQQEQQRFFTVCNHRHPLICLSASSIDAVCDCCRERLDRHAERSSNTVSFYTCQRCTFNLCRDCFQENREICTRITGIDDPCAGQMRRVPTTLSPSAPVAEDELEVHNPFTSRKPLLLSYIEPHSEEEEMMNQRIYQLNLELHAQKDTIQRLQKQEDRLRKSLELERRTRDEVQSKYDRLRGADEAISCLNMEELLSLEGEVVSVLTKLSERKQQLLRRTTSELLCVVCLDEPKRIMLSPCNHLCLCKNCANSGILNECPVCRARVSKRVEVFM